MTRRLIVFKMGDSFLVSQEFNGDMSEAEKIYGYTFIKANWPQIVELFDGVETPEQFEEAVRKAEKLYTYETAPLEAMAEIPNAEEVWAISHGNLILVTRYGKPLVEWLADVAEQFGFKSQYSNCEAVNIMAKNTDGRWCTWFTIILDVKGVREISGHNTDQCNIWLNETRPDMTAERCVESFEALSQTLGLFDTDKLSLSPWIDPEDWQEIARVPDAQEDERYSGRKRHDVMKTHKNSSDAVTDAQHAKNGESIRYRQ